MFLALVTLLGDYGGSGGTNGGGGYGGGGGGYGAGYWIIVGIVALVVFAGVAWAVMRFRSRRSRTSPETAPASESDRTDRAA